MEIKENCIHSWLLAVAFYSNHAASLLLTGNWKRRLRFEIDKSIQLYRTLGHVRCPHVRRNWSHKVWNYLSLLAVSHFAALTIFLLTFFPLTKGYTSISRVPAPLVVLEWTQHSQNRPSPLFSTYNLYWWRWRKTMGDRERNESNIILQ